MYTHAKKLKEDKSRSIVNAVSQKSGTGRQTLRFTDNRPHKDVQHLTGHIKTDIIQALGWESLGILNPRRYLPEFLGGYNQDQMKKNELQDEHLPANDKLQDKLQDTVEEKEKTKGKIEPLPIEDKGKGEVDSHPTEDGVTLKNKHSLTSTEAQALYMFLRSTGALPKLSSKDIEMMALMRRTLTEDECSLKEWRLITRFMIFFAKYDNTEEKNSLTEVKPPKGYSAKRAYGETVFIKGLDKLQTTHEALAISQLIGEKIHRSNKMTGAKSGDPYLHTSKSDSTSLYLITIDGNQDDIPMYTIVRQGHVSDGMHYFT